VPIRFKNFIFPASGAPVLLTCVIALGAGVAAVAIPGFASAANLTGLIAYLPAVLLLALGVGLVVLTGGIDLSVTAGVALTSITVARVLTASALVDMPLLLQLGAAGGVALGVALSLGLANGLLVSVTGMPSFLVTLATLMLGGGLAVWSTGSQVIGELPAPVVSLGQSPFVALGLALGAVVVAELVQARTIFGRWVLAVGRNATASTLSGVPVGRVLRSVYLASAGCASLAGLLLTARLETGSPVMGRELLLDAVGAVVVGGTRLSGGVGRPLWTVAGVLFFALLDNALNLLNVSYFAIMVVKGGVILAAAVAGSLRTRDVI
jgi:ribose/xylose/arabinose/galactoside ABC-type transport system permease subunit